MKLRNPVQIGSQSVNGEFDIAEESFFMDADLPFEEGKFCTGQDATETDVDRKDPKASRIHMDKKIKQSTQNGGASVNAVGAEKGTETLTNSDILSHRLHSTSLSVIPAHISNLESAIPRTDVGEDISIGRTDSTLQAQRPKRPKLSEECMRNNCDNSKSQLSIYNTQIMSYMENCNDLSGFSPSSTVEHTCSKSRGNNEVGRDSVANSQIDLSYDMGYASYSPNYGIPDRDNDGKSVMDEGVRNESLPAAQTLEDDNDLEDLLYHFRKFFQDQFEVEFRQFQTRMFNIIDTQQNHVRRIVYTSSAFRDSQGLEEDLFMSDDGENSCPQTPVKEYRKTVTNDSHTQLLTTQLPGRVPVCTDECVGEKHLLELMTLSSSCSTLLAKPQFHIAIH